MTVVNCQLGAMGAPPPPATAQAGAQAAPQGARLESTGAGAGVAESIRKMRGTRTETAEGSRALSGLGADYAHRPPRATNAATAPIPAAAMPTNSAACDLDALLLIFFASLSRLYRDLTHEPARAL